MWQVFPCSNCSDCLSHAQARTVPWLRVPQEKTSVPIVVKVPSGSQSKWLLGKPFLAKIFILDTESSLRVQELLAPSQKLKWSQVDMVSNCTVPGGVGSFTPSLHQAKQLQERMLAVCQQCLAFVFLKIELLYSSHMASLSLFELFGLSFARTGKNGVTWLRRAWRKKLMFQLSWKSTVAAKANGF